MHDPLPLQDVAELDAAISAVEERGMDIKVRTTWQAFLRLAVVNIRGIAFWKLAEPATCLLLKESYDHLVDKLYLYLNPAQLWLRT